MEQDMMETADFGYFELVRRLEAYADLRLSPSVAATTRMRKAVMTAAHRRAALIAADAWFETTAATTSARAAQQIVPARNVWRRPVAAVMAGCLTLAFVAGTALAAEPGGPLYAARIWTEMATLPSNPLERAQAEAVRLQHRVDEAQQAAAEGDVRGTEAALAAYSAIVAEATAGSAGDPAADAAIELSVEDHLAALTLMLDTVPASALGAAQAALSSSKTAIDAIDGSGGNGGRGIPGALPGSGPTVSPGPTKPDTGGGAAKPSPSPNNGQPTKSPAPPRATTSPKSGSTVKDHPSPTPSPHATDPHAPGGHGALQRDRL
jgi:hypothetical protein